MIQECTDTSYFPMIAQGVLWGASMLASYAISYASFAKANSLKDCAPMTESEFNLIVAQLKSFPSEMDSAQLKTYNSLLFVLKSRAPLGILPNEIYRREATKQIAAEAARLVREHLSIEIIEEVIEEEQTDELSQQVNDRCPTDGGIIRGDRRGDERLRVEDTISESQNRFSL